MRKIFIQLLLLLISLPIFGQNWEPFTKDSTVFFRVNSDETHSVLERAYSYEKNTILGYRLDSIVDNEYFGHPGGVKQKEGMPWLTGILSTANWFGLRMKYNDAAMSINVHLNYNLIPLQEFDDSNFIDLPIYGESGKIYKTRGKDNYDKRIISGDIQWVQLYNGLMDSVKYFYYQRNNSIDTLALSKNNGVVQWIFNTKRINPPPKITNRMMYDMKVGDMIQMLITSNLSSPTDYKTVVVKEVIDQYPKRTIVYYEHYEDRTTKFDNSFGLNDTIITTERTVEIEDIDGLFDSLMYKNGVLRIFDELVVGNDLKFQPKLIYGPTEIIIVDRSKARGIGCWKTDTGIFCDLLFEGISYFESLSSCFGKTISVYSKSAPGIGTTIWDMLLYMNTQCGETGTRFHHMGIEEHQKNLIKIIPKLNSDYEIAGMKEPSTIKIYSVDGRIVAENFGNSFSLKNVPFGVHVAVITNAAGEMITAKFYHGN